MRTTNDERDALDQTEVMIRLGNFLAWAAEDDAYFGGTPAEDAWKALQTFLGWDDERMETFRKVFVEPDE